MGTILYTRLVQKITLVREYYAAEERKPYHYIKSDWKPLKEVQDGKTVEKVIEEPHRVSSESLPILEAIMGYAEGFYDREQLPTVVPKEETDLP